MLALRLIQPGAAVLPWCAMGNGGWERSPLRCDVLTPLSLGALALRDQGTDSVISDVMLIIPNEVATVAALP
ncbi:unnamed protein product [Phytophthora fragariaefolia]|uniref:Unnamed protein product n=1 Tax=Phytophthora fragariaefolia TaxID=1490495 RepID=A0A9W7CSY5_9STRA|nr:unnamed protein product [Phytophthora fragariaefolia]